jgi:hypothetical protein
MPDEVITDLVQHGGGARAAAVFLSARVLQFDSRQTGTSTFQTALRELCSNASSLKKKSSKRAENFPGDGPPDQRHR